jgi:flagellar biosynthesis/type III secretory pathway M-ring protein FliF/YscJ
LLAAILEADKQSALRHFWWLWIGLFVLGVLLIRIVAAMSRRRRRGLQTDHSEKPPRAIKDAWQEAGRRAEPIPEDDPEEQL